LAISTFFIWLSVSYRIVGGCIVVFGDGMLLERSRYVGIVLPEEGLDLFFPFYGIVFPAAGDATGGSGSALLVASGDASGVRSYVWFNLQKIWPMCSRRPLLPIVVELIVSLLRSPCSWSLLLVGTMVLGSRSGVLPWSQWSFLKGCTSSDVRKTKYRDLVVCFNVILFYVKVSVVKGVLI
jgi:hypothetical protein